MNLPTKVNDLSGGKRNKRSATIMSKNDTHEKDGLTFIEGDNITFICEGNVTVDDNQAIIRCIVQSAVSQVPVYEDSEPLRIQFQVRIPVIELQPDKTVFPEGDSVQLKCQSEGNPSPSYAWLKGNGSNETIIAYTDSFVIENANIADSGLYTCYTNNSIDGNVYKAFNSIYISIENNHNILIWIGIAGGFLIIFAFIIAPVIYRRRAKSERFLKGIEKTTSKSYSENCTKSNPCYTSDSGTRINDNLNDSGNAMATRNDKLENEEKLIGKPSTSSSSKYAEENLNENSSDHYASPVPDVYDVLHDNRYKTDKGEAYDRMSELKSLPENGKKSNKSITNQDKTMIGSLPIHLGNSRLGGYESVVIDVDEPVISSGNNKYGHADLQTIREHTEEYMNNQKQEENKMNKSNQQTNSDPKSSFEYNQTGPQNNQAFEREEYQQVDSVSLDSIEDNGSKQ
ncbi:unnamed protein product [Mytilus edulis]|uniref:Ig-like domain-containing protein n=1 Tax=Mytilus edulis TaxID=6550 RepID=A0A8S3SUC9_MYTED|nr:unnamed protein product [Mytilus edulis]